MIITITGTPGTGKSYISKKIAKYGFKYFDLNAYIKKKKLYDTYDRKDKTFDVNPKKLKSIDLKKYSRKTALLNRLDRTHYDMEDFIRLVKNSKIKFKRSEDIIVDSHLSHCIRSDLCIVIKSDIKKLYARLKKRKYSEKKIRDNVESEIFDVCLEDASKYNKNLVVVYN